MESGISMEQLQAILAAQAEQNRSVLLEAIAAIKAPTETEKKKAAEEQERYDRSVKQSMEQARVEEEVKRNRELRCDHKKENGKYATGGQIIGGRFGLLVCQHCQKEWYAEFSQEVINQINAGDLTLHQADPSSWMTKDAWTAKQNAEAVA